MQRDGEGPSGPARLVVDIVSIVLALCRSRTRYARSGGLRIAYELRGTTHRRRPWLVLIHGMGFDRSGWRPVLRKLGRRFRLVLIDNRGTGHSDRPSGSFSVADMVGDVVAVLDAAGIGQAHVLGASLGGMVAQELAIRYPQRVDGLVLACTTPGWPSGYPMPAPLVRVMAATRRMPAEAALRRHTENALSALTVRDNPALVERLVGLQGLRPVDKEVLSAQASAGARYAGRRGIGRPRGLPLIGRRETTDSFSLNGRLSRPSGGTGAAAGPSRRRRCARCAPRPAAPRRGRPGSAGRWRAGSRRDHARGRVRTR